MSLKIVRRPKTPHWILRGTVRGISIEETTGTTDKAIAEQIRVKREAEILNESIYGKSVSMTFAHAAADYLEFADGEKRFLKPLVDYFATTPLRGIGQDEIDKAAKKILPKAGNATRNRQVYTPMSAILRHAARKAWCATPNLARPKQKEVPVRWIGPEEAERLIASCASHLRPLVMFLLYTGARTGEALWLDWGHVDLLMKQVTFPNTKNGETRSVPIHPRLLHELKLFEHRQGEVFRTHKGRPYRRPRNEKDGDTSAGTRIRSAFLTACKKAGIADFTPHCCRHTWATWHYQKNRDLTALQRLGGWKSVVMVLRYAHTNVQEHAASIENLPWASNGQQLKAKSGAVES